MPLRCGMRYLQTPAGSNCCVAPLCSLPLQVAHGYRPELTKPIPEGVQALIERCWKGLPELRPSMEEVVVELEKLQEQMQAQMPGGRHCAESAWVARGCSLERWRLAGLGEHDGNAQRAWICNASSAVANDRALLPSCPQRRSRPVRRLAARRPALATRARRRAAA